MRGGPINAPLILTSDLIYPESNSQPMADNSKQFRWIFVLFGNLAALFRDRNDVVGGGNLFWYPRLGQPEVRIAPDVVVGRPKGDRRSYEQWEEDNVPLTVDFAILSPGNTVSEMADKHAFYEEHGVEEYYLFDPDTNHLTVYIRQGEVRRRVRPTHDSVSPQLGIRFDLSETEWAGFYPDEERFLSFEELADSRDQSRKQAMRLAELSQKVRREQALDRLVSTFLPRQP